MHPILANHRRLLLYLLAWTPILGLLVYMSAALTGVPAWWALEVFAPACLVFAFVCLSPWQICRARPLRPGQAAPLLYLFLGAGTAGSLAFLGTAASVAYAISRASVLNGGVVGMLFGLGILLYLLSAGLHYAALAVEASHRAEKREAEARALAREAQLESLRIQLNPHFLFNSLHSIAALATLDGGRAREMCLKLADFLRSSLRLGERDIIPLGEEVALARQYLEVERVRFGARLQVETRIAADCENCGVPALLLQPLVENAVKHGIAGLVEGGAIRLQAERSGGEVTITLENGLDEESGTAEPGGIGLENVRRRLRVRYGQRGHFAAGAGDGVYRVELRLPCESSIASSSRA